MDKTIFSLPPFKPLLPNPSSYLGGQISRSSNYFFPFPTTLAGSERKKVTALLQNKRKIKSGKNREMKTGKEKTVNWR